MAQRQEQLRESWGKVKHIVVFYFNTLRRLFSRQQLKIPKKKVCYSEPFQFSHLFKNQWYDLFDADKNIPIPFSYYSPTIVRSFLHIMNKLHVNYKNLLHLRHEELFIHPEAIKPKQKYYCKNELLDIVPLRRNTVALLISSKILDLSNNPLIQAKNTVFVKDVKLKSLSKLKNSELYGNKQDRSLIKMALKRPTLLDDSEATVESLVVTRKIGVRYGLISGDLNFIHTNKFLAKLFGFKDVFIQGMCTVNYLFKVFIETHKKQLSSFTITFTSPVYEGEEIYLRVKEKQFEITDKADRLLAYGEMSFK